MEKHLWKHRVLLIYTTTKNSKELEDQLVILKEHQKGLAERKLVIYSYTKKAFTVNFQNNWKASTKLFSEYHPENSTFKVLLLGLDGGIKLAQKTKLSVEKLFAMIDGMPIRKREIRRKNK